MSDATWPAMKGNMGYFYSLLKTQSGCTNHFSTDEKDYRR